MTISILPPIADPKSAPAASLHDIIYGQKIEPIDMLRTYSDKKFEAFILEWAFEYLQKLSGKYVQVSRFGGAGDKGRDVVCYKSLNPATCDVYQCKHYGSALSPTDARIELAKLCYNTHERSIPVPDQYRIVALNDIGPTLGKLLEDPNELKSDLIRYWTNTTGKRPICSRLVKGRTVELKGTLQTWVDGFDFSIVRHKPIHEVIDEFRQTPLFPSRFGGGLTKPLPPDQQPPVDPSADELVYVNALLDAYKDNLKVEQLDIQGLKDYQRLTAHYDRSRERFYCAETIREFAKDSLPHPFTFDEVCSSVYDAVVDIEQQDWPCGYTRVLEVTKHASSLNISDTPLQSYLKPKSLQGICHQLANAGQLKWVHSWQ